MSYTRQQWVTDVLRAIGNKSPNSATINWVIGWTNYETAAGQSAAYNLLNTTQPAIGATNYNSVGVKNYTSYSQGINATAQTLQNGYYPTLLNDLKSNNVADLTSNPLVTKELAIWGTGKSGAQIAAAGTHGATDTFSGTASAIGNIPVVGSVANAAIAVLGISGANSSGATGLQIGNLPPIGLAPNADVTQVLVAIDTALALINPFFIQGGQIDTIGVLGASVSFLDPVSWLIGFGLNIVEDFVALICRASLIALGLFCIFKVISNFIDVQQLATSAASTAMQFAPFIAA
jgi:hypothetical protein